MKRENPIGSDPHRLGVLMLTICAYIRLSLSEFLTIQRFHRLNNVKQGSAILLIGK